MGNRLPRIPRTLTSVLGAATLTLLWLPGSMHAQSTATQDRQVTATQGTQSTATQDKQAVQSDDITRRDLARFDQFLDSHRETAEQLRRTPSLIDDPQYLQSHPELSAYLQEHPSVRQEISQQPDTFMRLENSYDRDSNLRDRDAGGRVAGGQDRVANRSDMANLNRFLDGHREIAEQVRKDPSLLDNRNFVQSHPALQSYLQDNPGVRDQLRQSPNAFMQQENSYNRDSSLRNAGGQDRDASRSDMANLNRFLDGHREIAEQVRKDPSLLDNRNFVQSHPALQSYLQDNPGVRDQLRQSPNTFMQQENSYDRDSSLRNAGGQDRDASRSDVANLNRFLDGHREIAEQVRKDPSLLDNRNFVQNHPALQAYLQDNPGVRDQLRQSPNTFMQQENSYNRDSNLRDRDPMHDRMANFGGFLGSHPDVQKDLSRNASVIKDQKYMQNHAELNTYLNAHPDVRAELMANPHSFVQGAQQYNNGSATGTAGGAGVKGSGTGTTGSTGSTGSSTGSWTGAPKNPAATPPNPPATPQNPKPNQ